MHDRNIGKLIMQLLANGTQNMVSLSFARMQREESGLLLTELSRGDNSGLSCHLFLCLTRMKRAVVVVVKKKRRLKWGYNSAWIKSLCCTICMWTAPVMWRRSTYQGVVYSRYVTATHPHCFLSEHN